MPVTSDQIQSLTSTVLASLPINELTVANPIHHLQHLFDNVHNAAIKPVLLSAYSEHPDDFEAFVSPPIHAVLNASPLVTGYTDEIKNTLLNTIVVFLKHKAQEYSATAPAPAAPRAVPRPEAL